MPLRGGAVGAAPAARGAGETASSAHPRFGLFLPPIRMSWETILERALAAEAAGFDSLWLIDHLAAPALPEADCLEGWTVATALAAHTRRLRIGHLVLCASFRHPALLAKMAATLDRVSGGRLELGLGWGSVPQELATFGFGAEPPRVRAARLRETLEILKLLFTGEPVSYAGRYWQLDGAIARPRPLQDPLPLHIGGAGRELTLPLVAEFADWWNCPSYATEHLAALRPLAGRARVSVQHPVGFVTDPGQRERVAATAQKRFGAWGGLLVGSAEELAAALRAEVAAGVGLFVLQFSDFGEPATLERFAREVMPAVRAT